MIDDEARLLATLARFLTREGLEVVQATSFTDASDHLYPGRFDVLVSDIVMPDCTGLRILQEVVEVRKCQEPVILITGEPNLETASEAVRSGAFDYIQKPVTKDRLLEVVNRGLKHVRLLRERDDARHRELQLLKNLAEIGESASILTHEIKTPINALRHALRAVGEKLGVDDGVVIEEFVGNLARIERLLGETLSFAKPFTPKLSHTSLAAVLGGAVEQVRASKGGDAVDVEVDLDQDYPLEADAQILGEVFSNLVRNAAEAGARHVGITARSGAEWICVDVQDDGPGIPLRDREDVFKPFHSTKDHGTGIGLAFSRKVIDAHGGRIELAATDSGACFRIELPACAVDSPGDGAGR
jgi:signal transduction histidine kinase